MRLTDFDTEDSPKLPQNFINNMKHTSDFDDMNVPYFDRLAVLVLEGIATDEERAEYAKLLISSEKNQQTASIYSKCRLASDAIIKMPKAYRLKHQRLSLTLLWKITAAAAVVALAWLGIAHYSSEHDSETIDGIAERKVCPVPREVYCASDEVQDVIVANNKSVAAYKHESIVPDNQQEADLLFPEPMDCGIIEMPALPTQLICQVAEPEIVIPVFEQEPANELKIVVVSYFSNRFGHIKEAVDNRHRRIRDKGTRLIDGIPLPVELVRNGDGEVCEVVVTAFNKTFTYRRQL